VSTSDVPTILDVADGEAIPVGVDYLQLSTDGRLRR
jgi:hypothetical protein